MRDYLITLLPVLWAIVSTAIALILYRTSEGLFEQRGTNKSTTRRIRLTGSVVIAALAFVGMAKTTPQHVMTIDPGDAAILPLSEVRLLRDRIAVLEDQFIELKGCVNVKGAENCVSQLDALTAAMGNVKESASHLSPPRKK